jgi:hypothetical protein
MFLQSSRAAAMVDRRTSRTILVRFCMVGKGIKEKRKGVFVIVKWGGLGV